MQQAEENRRFGEKTIAVCRRDSPLQQGAAGRFSALCRREAASSLIGATTENPSFEVNGALLSRCKVFVLQALSAEDLTHAAAAARLRIPAALAS